MNQPNTRIATKQGEYIIRPYVADDLPAVLSAWQVAFGKPLSPTLWQWKYHDAPLGHQILLCLDGGGEVAAFYGGVPLDAAWQGRAVRITQSMDAFSHPAHRCLSGGRGGLFVKTALAYFARYGGPRGSALLFGLGGDRHFRLGHRLLGYEALPGGMCCLEAQTEALVTLSGWPFAGRLALIAEDDLHGLAALASASPPERLVARRDADFFRWRFLRHPERRYRLFRYGPWMGPGWRGYAVVLMESAAAVLVDLVLPAGERSARNLLRCLAEVLQSDGVERLRTWLPWAGPDARRLIACGFTAQPEPLGIVPSVRRLDPTLRWSATAAALHYTMADADLF